MVRCEINVTGGLSSVAKIGCAKLALPQGQELVDMQFIDDSLLMMVLWDKSNFARRFRLPGCLLLLHRCRLRGNDVDGLHKAVVSRGLRRFQQLAELV